MRWRRALVIPLLLAAALELSVRVCFTHFICSYYVEMWRYGTLLKRPADGARLHEHRPNLSATVMRVPVRTNSQGLRDDEMPLAKPAGTYRIALLGDSLTFGFGVRKEETFADRLEQELNREANPLRKRYGRIEVVNLGIGNYNTGQEFASFLETGLLYEPDEALLAFFVNDLEEPQAVEKSFLMRHSMAYALGSSLWNAYRKRFSDGRDYVSYYKSFYTKEGLDRWGEGVRQMAAEMRRRKIPFRVILLPELHRLKDYPFVEEERRVKRIFADNGVPVADARSHFDPVPEGSRYWVARDDAHPNALAHRLIAEAVFEAFYRGSR